MLKNKKLLTFIILVLILLGNISFVSAAFETPGLPQMDKIEDFISFFFGKAILFCVAIAVISLAIGGVGLITSLDNPEARSNAIDRIKGSILGLILTVSGYIILNTINPVLVSPIVAGLPNGFGIVYYNGSDTKTAPTASADASQRPAGYDSLKYICPNNVGDNLFVIKFPGKGYTDSSGFPGTVVEEISCGGAASLGGIGSFTTLFKRPGVYFHTQPGCKGAMSDTITASENEVGTAFLGNIKSIRIVDYVDRQRPENSVYYGAILHKSTNYNNGGLCTLPLEGKTCVEISIPVFSAHVFAINKANYKTSGDGVNFFSETYGWDSGQNAGFNLVTSDKINPIYNISASSINFSYTGIDRTDEYKRLYTDFKKRPGSIQVKGTYIVALYSGAAGSAAPISCPCTPPATGQCSNPNPGQPCPSTTGSGGTAGGSCVEDPTNNSCSSGQASYCQGGTWHPCSSTGGSGGSGSSSGDNSYCQVFEKDVNNLNAEEFLAAGSGGLNTVYIIAKTR